MNPRLLGLPSPFVTGSILASIQQSRLVIGAPSHSTQLTLPFEPKTFLLRPLQPTDGPLPRGSEESSSFEYNVYTKDDHKNYPTKVLDQEPDN